MRLGGVGFARASSFGRGVDFYVVHGGTFFTIWGAFDADGVARAKG